MMDAPRSLRHVQVLDSDIVEEGFRWLTVLSLGLLLHTGIHAWSAWIAGENFDLMPIRTPTIGM